MQNTNEIKIPNLDIQTFINYKIISENEKESDSTTVRVGDSLYLYIDIIAKNFDDENKNINIASIINIPSSSSYNVSFLEGHLYDEETLPYKIIARTSNGEEVITNKYTIKIDIIEKSDIPIYIEFDKYYSSYNFKKIIEVQEKKIPKLDITTSFIYKEHDGDKLSNVEKGSGESSLYVYIKIIAENKDVNDSNFYIPVTISVPKSDIYKTEFVEGTLSNIIDNSSCEASVYTSNNGNLYENIFVIKIDAVDKVSVPIQMIFPKEYKEYNLKKIVEIEGKKVQNLNITTSFLYEEAFGNQLIEVDKGTVGESLYFYVKIIAENKDANDNNLHIPVSINIPSSSKYKVEFMEGKLNNVSNNIYKVIADTYNKDELYENVFVFKIDDLDEVSIPVEILFTREYSVFNIRKNIEIYKKTIEIPDIKFDTSFYAGKDIKKVHPLSGQEFKVGDTVYLFVKINAYNYDNEISYANINIPISNEYSLYFTKGTIQSTDKNNTPYRISVSSGANGNDNEFVIKITAKKACKIPISIDFGPNYKSYNAVTEINFRKKILFFF